MPNQDLHVLTLPQVRHQWQIERVQGVRAKRLRYDAVELVPVSPHLEQIGIVWVQLQIIYHGGSVLVAVKCSDGVVHRGIKKCTLLDVQVDIDHSFLDRLVGFRVVHLNGNKSVLLLFRDSESF